MSFTNSQIYTAEKELYFLRLQLPLPKKEKKKAGPRSTMVKHLLPMILGFSYRCIILNNYISLGILKIVYYKICGKSREYWSSMP
jgi:hypothetical protein